MCEQGGQAQGEAHAFETHTPNDPGLTRRTFSFLFPVPSPGPGMEETALYSTDSLNE